MNWFLTAALAAIGAWKATEWIFRLVDQLDGR